MGCFSLPPLWVLGLPSPRAPTPLGAPGGNFGPHKSTHTSPSSTFIGVTCEPRGGDWAPPSSLSHTPIPARLLLGLGKGDVAAPRAAAFHPPPTPCPESCSAPTAEVGEHGGGGGGVHECPSAHSFVQQLLLPGVMGAQWVPSCCSGCAAWGQSGDNHCWDRAGSLRGWWDEDGTPSRPGAGMDEMPAALTGCGGQGDRLGPAACACLQLAVDGGGVVSLLGARKQGESPPRATHLLAGGWSQPLPGWGHGGPGKCPSMSPRGTSPSTPGARSRFQGDGVCGRGLQPPAQGMSGTQRDRQPGGKG